MSGETLIGFMLWSALMFVVGAAVGAIGGGDAMRLWVSGRNERAKLKLEIEREQRIAIWKYSATSKDP